MNCSNFTASDSVVRFIFIFYVFLNGWYCKFCYDSAMRMSSPSSCVRARASNASTVRPSCKLDQIPLQLLCTCYMLMHKLLGVNKICWNCAPGTCKISYIKYSSYVHLVDILFLWPNNCWLMMVLKYNLCRQIGGPKLKCRKFCSHHVRMILGLIWWPFWPEFCTPAVSCWCNSNVL